MNGSKEKARLDPNRDCKPKTEIVKIFPNDQKCIGPHSEPQTISSGVETPAAAYEIRNTLCQYCKDAGGNDPSWDCDCHKRNR